MLARCRPATFPLGGSTVRLRRQTPYILAMELLLTAREVPADVALRIGLIGHVVPAGTALEKALEIAGLNGPLAVEAIRRSVRETEGMSEVDGLFIEVLPGQMLGIVGQRRGWRRGAAGRSGVAAHDGRGDQVARRSRSEDPAGLSAHALMGHVLRTDLQPSRRRPHLRVRLDRDAAPKDSRIRGRAGHPRRLIGPLVQQLVASQSQDAEGAVTTRQAQASLTPVAGQRITDLPKRSSASMA